MGTATIASFNDDWSVRRDQDDVGIRIRLPHDAMLGEPRSPDADGGAPTGYFPGGRYVYTKSWRPPAELRGQRLSLEFEGVYGQTVVLIDGTQVARNQSGYTAFEVSLPPLSRSGVYEIEVRVDNSPLPNTRWYSGSGIYRPVWLHAKSSAAFAFDGVRVTTISVADPAVVVVDIDLDTDAEGYAVTARVSDAREVVATAVSEATGGIARIELHIPNPRLWSDRDPHLYDVTVTLTSGSDIHEELSLRYGLRTIAVRPGAGLLINGQETLLRGACIHHDNGLLGAATFRAAEFRRARILKQNGFNAIRSAHNPMSRDLLDACDELGLYVMDELTDTWFMPKTAHDGSARFDATWRDDARAMIASDRNHASVIMYSLGNEIAEAGTPRGVETTRSLAEFFTELDPHRPTTLSINFLLNVMASFNFSLEELIAENTKPRGPRKAATSTAANAVANALGRVTDLVPLLPKADKVSRDAFAEVAIAGYNYAFTRYGGDARRHPTRIIVGSESLPGAIVDIWKRVEQFPNVIGDFVWTGWDYLGEAGIGAWRYGNEPAGLVKPFPQILGGAGAIDITGVAGAATLLPRAVWGELDAPEVAVRPLDLAGQRVTKTNWRYTDAIRSWAWRGKEGTRAEVEVYSADDEVELLLNGRSLGRKKAGRSTGFISRFQVGYAAGELTAVGYRSGVEAGRSSLRSTAGDLKLTISSDESDLVANGQDLAFVRIEITDESGVVEMMADDDISIEIHGPATLAGLGSAAPTTTASYSSHTHSTYYGRALAIVRASDSSGTVTVSAYSGKYGTATLSLSVRSPDSSTTGAVLSHTARDRPHS